MIQSPVGGWPPRNGPEREPSSLVLNRIVAVVALGVFLALLLDPLALPWLLRTFLSFAAVNAALLAWLAGEEFWEDRVTRWDEAASYVALAILSSWLLGAPGSGAA